MKIVIPVSSHDKHLLADHTACLTKMGGLEEHQVIYFPTLSAKEHTYQHALPGATVHPIDMDFVDGAPAACNNHFASVVITLGTMGNTDPFLWMELDMLPWAPRWPDALLREYRQQGKPFLGNVVPTPHVQDGQLVFPEGDIMMMGCGVYPPGMDRDERIKPLIYDLAKTGTRNPRVPFDVYIRWAVRNIGVADTLLIDDKWATEKYELTEAGVFCQSVDHGARLVRKRQGRVADLALLVHGCKDGSAAKLVLGGRKPAPKPESFAKYQPEAPRGLDGKLGPDDSSLGSIADGPPGVPGVPDEASFWDEPENKEQVIPVKAPEIKPKHTVTPPKPAVEYPPISSDLTRAKIEEALGGKKMRIRDLAEKLGVEVTELAGTFPRTGYVVKNSGWVESTIPITQD